VKHGSTRALVLGRPAVAAALAALATLATLATALAACKRTDPAPAASADRRAEMTDPSAPRAPASREAPPREDPPTYYGSVAPILESRCVSCHAPHGIGPFPLQTYAQAREHHDEIADATAEREMPPWLPETASCAKLRHPRALTAGELDVIQRWAKAVAPEGDQNAPRARAAAAATHDAYERVDGPPDRSVAPERAYAPKPPKVLGRGDDYHCFVLDPALDRKASVTALRVTPGAGALVHHVILYEVRKSAAAAIEARDRADPAAGYTCFGGIGVAPTIRKGDLAKGELVDFDAQMIAAWAPGGGATDVAGAPTALPAGTAIRLAAGSKLVLQVHYSLENYRAGMSDRTRVDMWFAKEPRKQAVWVPLLKYDFRVPPGAGPDDPRARARGQIELPFPLTVLGAAGHMHLRGRSIRVDAVREGAPDECLLDIPRWEFGHQEAYWLERGVRIDRAAVTCTWDNRPEAQPVVNGKRRKTKELRWGEGTEDEMCLAFLYATL
jgi:hypothetical protein